MGDEKWLHDTSEALEVAKKFIKDDFKEDEADTVIGVFIALGGHIGATAASLTLLAYFGQEDEAQDSWLKEAHEVHQKLFPYAVTASIVIASRNHPDNWLSELRRMNNARNN